jgi:lysophospholipase L1-like esterase
MKALLPRVLPFLAALACASPLPAGAAASGWIGTWGAAPTPPILSATVRSRISASFDNQTLRQVVRISAGGSWLRIRLSNEYGRAPLRIGAARIALAGPNGSTVGESRVVTFGGSPTAVIPPGAPLLSDPVEMKTAALSSLAVSLYLPEPTGPCTCHPIGAQTGFLSGPGDFTAAAEFPAEQRFVYRAFLSGVEAAPDRPASEIVVFGDSISDGTVSTPDLNQRWPDRLAERLQKRDGSRRAWGVVNAAISGNQVLGNGSSTNGLARFDRDVLSVPGARYVVVFLGVNDLGVNLGPSAPGAPPRPGPRLTADDLIAGHRQLIERAHAHGLKIYGATLTPYEGAGYWSPEGEAGRQALNQWIRTSGAYDGVIDFDAAWRDPAQPSRIREGLAAADHLHGTDLGYRILGDAVDLALFR